MRVEVTAEEQAGLKDLFGQPAQWGGTLRSMLWTSVTVVVPSFESSTVVDLPVPCTFDFNIAATKYFAALEDGDLPLSFYFNGSVFYAGEDGGLQVVQIPWEKEASYRMPAKVWGHDGFLLPQFRMAVLDAGRIRPSLRKNCACRSAIQLGARKAGIVCGRR